MADLEIVGSLMVVVVTCFLVVLTANFVPSTPMIAACMSGVVLEHSQFACLSPPCKLEGEAEASMASLVFVSLGFFCRNLKVEADSCKAEKSGTSR